MNIAGVIDRKVLAWAAYDWANSAFALSVLAVLFPLFLANYWSAGDSGPAVTARLGWITAGANFVVAVAAPIFGTIADKGGYRKRFLLILAAIGAAATAALSLVGEGAWPCALLLYLFASVGFYSSTLFYDSLLVDVAKPRDYDFVSALGFALGYLGGALLLGLHVWMLLAPQTFGIVGPERVIKLAFATVGVWWAVFSLPLAFFVPERRRDIAIAGRVIRAAYAELRATLFRVGQYRNVVVFLVAYWLYVGGVFTVISMAINYGQRLGFDQQDLVLAFLMTNFAGFPATLLYGYCSRRFGPRPCLFFALGVYIAVSSWAVFMQDVQQFYIMAVTVGCVQGGVQGLSRSLYARLIPPEHPGEFFGFYNMTTKAAHVFGPALVGAAATFSEAPQVVLFVLLPLFVAGAIMLAVVRVGNAPAVPGPRG